MSKKEENILLVAAFQYANKNGLSLSKVSWALSSILDKPDNVIYHQLRTLEADEVEDMLQGADLPDFDASVNELEPDEEVLENRLGDVVRVKAVSIRTYGVVCSVEGSTRTLLLHIGEIANEFIEDVSEYVEVGDTFEAMLITNPSDQLALSTRRFSPLSRKRHIDRQTAVKGE